MRKILACATLAAAALGVPGPATAVVEGCTVLPNSVCEYAATAAGNIAAVGEWTVEVWWSGTCGADVAPDYTRSSAPHAAYPQSEGDNNLPGGVGGTWEGTVAPGACARVTTGQGVALVGNVVVPG
ncbi:MAG: hypothetical protein ACRDJM_11150 [Actinomycetota bacterium]